MSETVKSELLTPREAAAFLHSSIQHLGELVGSGDIAYVDIARMGAKRECRRSSGMSSFPLSWKGRRDDVR